jgi:hypothetical protein
MATSFFRQPCQCHWYLSYFTLHLKLQGLEEVPASSDGTSSIEIPPKFYEAPKVCFIIICGVIFCLKRKVRKEIQIRKEY